MREEHYDVVVLGGGCSGVAAALAASRCGKNTLLAERQGAFGGAATTAWVSAFCGFYTQGKNPKQVVFGIGEEVLQRMRTYGEDIRYTVSPNTGNASIRFHPEIVKLVMDDLLRESSVKARLFTTGIEVKKGQSRLEALILQDEEETYCVHASAYIDATGNGNLLHLAGLETDWGNADGEVQQASLSCLLQNIPTREIPMTILTDAVCAGRQDLANAALLDKDRGLIVKIPKEDSGYLTMPSADLSGLSGEEKTETMQMLRRKAYAYWQALRDHAEGFQAAKLLMTAPEIGIRESRRMRGEDVIRGRDVLESRKRSDAVARGGWPVEMHHPEGLRYEKPRDDDWFDIPMGALCSRDMENLFACGRDISCDSMALASLRVMGTGFATGQAAGVMAALYRPGIHLHAEEVRKVLKDQDARLL